MLPTRPRPLLEALHVASASPPLAGANDMAPVGWRTLLRSPVLALRVAMLRLRWAWAEATR